MEEVLKSAVKKAPVPTLAVAFLYFIISKVLEKPVETWVIGLILGLAFIFSCAVLYLSYKQGGHPDEDNPARDNDESKVIIEGNTVDDIDTGGGDAVLGSASQSDNTSPSSTAISDNKVSKVNTDGGDFVLGVKQGGDDA